MNVGKVRRAEVHIHIHDSKSNLFAKFDLGFLKAIAKKESVPWFIKFGEEEGLFRGGC